MSRLNVWNVVSLNYQFIRRYLVFFNQNRELLQFHVNVYENGKCIFLKKKNFLNSEK